MNCLFCKQEINDDASVCPYCNAYKTTNGENRFSNGGSILSVGLFFSWWAGTVGLVWCAVIFGAFISTAYPIFVEKSLFFQTTNWDCRLNYVYVVHNNPKNPTDAQLKSIGVTRRFDNGKPVYLKPSWAELLTIKTKEFAFLKANKDGKYLNSSEPKCDSAENKEIVTEKVKNFDTVNSNGSKITYENISIGDPIFDKIERSSASFIDYLAGVILSALILIIGFPIARFVTKIWKAIFRSDQVIWVRRK